MIDLKFQHRAWAWITATVGELEPAYYVLGAVEEVAHLSRVVEAGDQDGQLDAIGTTSIFLMGFCSSLKLNFSMLLRSLDPPPGRSSVSSLPWVASAELVGLVQETGKLARAAIKRRQGVVSELEHRSLAIEAAGGMARRLRDCAARRGHDYEMLVALVLSNYITKSKG